MPVRGVIVLIVLLSFIAAPVAMAVDGCSWMGTGCGGSCSAPCTPTPTSASYPVFVPVASLMPAILAHVLITTLGAPDAPPKSRLSA